jgi:hypothetical protein
MPRSIRICAELTLVLATAASAQATDGAGIRVGTSSFMFARYATVSSSSLYAAYSLGAVAVVFGMVNNPRSGYHELIGGLVTRISSGKQGINVAVAAADASDGRYLQTYLVPSLTLARLSLSSTIEWYEPLGQSGVRQLDVNPISALIALDRRIGIGGAYTASLAEDSRSRQRIGPALRVAILGVYLSGEILRNLRRSAPEVRLGMQASF